MIALKLAMRESRSRPLRAALTLASVVIGVAALVAVTLASQTATKAFNAIYESVAGRAALEVRGSFGTSFPEAVQVKIAALDGVKAAAPRVQRMTKLYFGGRTFQIFGLGIDREIDQLVQKYELQDGAWYTDAATLALSDAFAADAGISVGDRVMLLTPAGRLNAKVTGLYTTDVATAGGQAPMLLMSLKRAQAWFKAPRRLDAIQMVLNDDADEAAVQKAVAALLPDNASVRPPASRSPMAEETSLSTEQGLLMARAFAMLLAVFIIANTFLISVTQRRRQFGIMRAIGATKRQIQQTIFAQAILLGASGTLIGGLLGVGGAHYLAKAMGALNETVLPAAELTLAPFLWALLFGMSVSLVGAILPARKAANLDPIEAMRDVLPAEIEGVSRSMAISGVTISVVAAGLLAASILGYIEMKHSVWASVALLVGLVLLLPLALRPLAASVARLVPRWMRVEARLASRHLLTHRSRTTLTVGVVFIAVAVALGLANAVMDNVNNVRGWYRKSIVADFIVRADSPDTSTGLSADIPDDVDEQIRQVPGMANIDTMRLVSAEAGGEGVLVFVSKFDDPELSAFDLAASDNDATVRRRMDEGEVVIGSVLAQRAGVHKGEKLSMEMGSKTHDFTVAAVANDYQAGGLSVYMDSVVAERLMGVGGVTAYVIRVEDGQTESVRKALRDLTREHGLTLQASSDIQKRIDGMMAGVVAGLWSMVVLLVLVAAFGVTNTLTMSVMEQTFELGLLRIIATTRNQVRKMIFAQALVMGLLAVVPGVIAGVAIGYLIHLSTLTVIGHPVAFGIYPWLLIVGLVGGLGLVLLAAFLPAERAARLELPTAIRLR